MFSLWPSVCLSLFICGHCQSNELPCRRTGLVFLFFIKWCHWTCRPVGVFCKQNVTLIIWTAGISFVFVFYRLAVFCDDVFTGRFKEFKTNSQPHSNWFRLNSILVTDAMHRVLTLSSGCNLQYIPQTYCWIYINIPIKDEIVSNFQYWHSQPIFFLR